MFECELSSIYLNFNSLRSDVLTLKTVSFCPYVIHDMKRPIGPWKPLMKDFKTLSFFEMTKWDPFGTVHLKSLHYEDQAY